MHVRHIVLFKFSALTAEKEALISKAMEGLEKTPIKVSNYGFGRTFTERGNGYTHCLSLDLESKEDLEKYAVDEYHVSVINNFIKPYLDKTAGAPTVLAMDFIV